MSECKDAVMLFLKLIGVSAAALVVVTMLIVGGISLIKYVLYLVGLLT